MAYTINNIRDMNKTIVIKAGAAKNILPGVFSCYSIKNTTMFLCSFALYNALSAIAMIFSASCS